MTQRIAWLIEQEITVVRCTYTGLDFLFIQLLHVQWIRSITIVRCIFIWFETNHVDLIVLILIIRTIRWGNWTLAIGLNMSIDMLYATHFAYNWRVFCLLSFPCVNRLSCLSSITNNLWSTNLCDFMFIFISFMINRWNLITTLAATIWYIIICTFWCTWFC